MRLGRRLAKVLILGLVLIALITAGAAWFAYALVTDSETASRLIKAKAARFLPRSIVEMGRVNIGILKGEVTVSHFHVFQRIDGLSFLTARIPWLSVKLDPRQVLHGKFVPREVVVSQPTLRVCRRTDGTWNLQGLVANPWPGPTIKNPPPIVIRNGTIELVGDMGAEDDAGVLPVSALRLARGAGSNVTAKSSGPGARSNSRGETRRSPHRQRPSGRKVPSKPRANRQRPKAPGRPARQPNRAWPFSAMSG